MCPLSSLSSYFKVHIEGFLPKVYSVYLLLFALNKVGEIVLLEVYKPTDATIELKVLNMVAKFNLF